MFNSPIKIIDLVTLLFLSLLVVIIVFIILQRNIKRFKLRNDRDPHFLSCKSIPKELRDAIQNKHTVSHAYHEPATLLTTNYRSLSDEKAKSFIIRMKAFENSQNLENALYQCGYTRPLTSKFEEFIEGLINSKDDFVLEKNLLEEFNKLYIWAMLDPMKFDNEQLRKLNLLINTIIEKLAMKKPLEKNKILQHKLDLDVNGDRDFNKNFDIIPNKADKMKKDLTKSSQLFSKDQPQCSYINIEKMNFVEENNDAETSKSSKIKTHLKNVFNSRKNSVDSNQNFNNNNSNSKATSSNSLSKEKKISTSKYEEIKDSSFDSQISTNRANDQNFINRWSITNDSIKAFDSENEEIPLVSSKASQKKKSVHSLTNVQNQSSSAKNNNGENVFLTSKGFGEENEGFQTYETNF